MTDSPKRVAIIEDDPDFGVYMTMLVETQLGAPAKLYPDGLEGLIGCLNEPPVMVVLDLELPSMHGEEILRRLRSSPHTRHVPIMICSSMADPQKQELSVLRIGADRYLEKTFDDKRLIGTLRDLYQRGLQEDSETQDSSRIRSNGTMDSENHTPPEIYHAEYNDPSKAGTFAGYRIQGILGAGGMGTVYEASHPRHGQVAIKVLLRTLTTNPNAVERFLREERTMRALDHPNVIRIMDSGRTAYSYFFTMEIVRGQPLDRLIDAGNLPMGQKRSIISQAFDAIIYLHSQGVLHRDLKPSNFILRNDRVLKVGDFGISWNPVFSAVSAARLTRDASYVGTPAFMAPEQLGGAEATPETDQYALARTLQCLLEDGRPSIPPKPLSVKRPDLPKALEEVLLRMLDVHADRRFPTLADAKVAMLDAMPLDPDDENTILE